MVVIGVPAEDKDEPRIGLTPETVKKLVGLGETAEDLIPFDPDEFIDALFA